MSQLKPISELRPVSNPAVVEHQNMRFVICELTGRLCRYFAALPDAKKADSTKVTWRGAFTDYESALAYANSLVNAGQLTAEQFDVIKAQITRKLGFMPAIPAVDATSLYPRGPESADQYLTSYLSATSIMDKEMFTVPEKKPKTEKPGRYDGFEVVTDKKGALTTEGSKPGFTAQGVSSLLVPWEANAEQAAAHCYSWLVTLDGAKPPQKVTVTEYATPKQTEHFHGKPGDKKGTKVRALILRNAKPAPVVAEPEKPKKTAKRATKTVDADAAAPATVSKKRKVATA